MWWARTSSPPACLLADWDAGDAGDDVELEDDELQELEELEA